VYSETGFESEGEAPVADWIQQVLASHGFVILCGGTLFFLIACGLGFPAPEELIFLSAGFSASQLDLSRSEIAILCIVGVLGILAGDSVPFLLGRHYGMSLLNRPRLAKLMTPERISRVQSYFRRWGARTIFVARFLAGLRIPTFFMAATMGVRYRTFLLCNGLGALISCPTSIVLAWYCGPYAKHILHKSRGYIFAALAIVVLISIYEWRKHRNSPPPPPVSPSGGTSAPNASKQASDAGHAEVTR
jgi:membrane protein DedA with SNARE-associated domain